MASFARLLGDDHLLGPLFSLDSVGLVLDHLAVASDGSDVGQVVLIHCNGAVRATAMQVLVLMTLKIRFGYVVILLTTLKFGFFELSTGCSGGIRRRDAIVLQSSLTVIILGAFLFLGVLPANTLRWIRA